MRGGGGGLDVEEESLRGLRSICDWLIELISLAASLRAGLGTFSEVGVLVALRKGLLLLQLCAQLDERGG